MVTREYAQGCDQGRGNDINFGRTTSPDRFSTVKLTTFSHIRGYGKSLL